MELPSYSTTREQVRGAVREDGGEGNALLEAPALCSLTGMGGRVSGDQGVFTGCGKSHFMAGGAGRKLGFYGSLSINSD